MVVQEVVNTGIASISEGIAIHHYFPPFNRPDATFSHRREDVVELMAISSKAIGNTALHPFGDRAPHVCSRTVKDDGTTECSLERTRRRRPVQGELVPARVPSANARDSRVVGPDVRNPVINEGDPGRPGSVPWAEYSRRVRTQRDGRPVVFAFVIDLPRIGHSSAPWLELNS